MVTINSMVVELDPAPQLTPAYYLRLVRGPIRREVRQKSTRSVDTIHRTLEGSRLAQVGLYKVHVLLAPSSRCEVIQLQELAQPISQTKHPVRRCMRKHGA